MENYLQVADVEPLVDRVIDGGSGLGGSGRNGLDNGVVGTNLVGAVLDRDVAPKNKKLKVRQREWTASYSPGHPSLKEYGSRTP